MQNAQAISASIARAAIVVDHSAILIAIIPADDAALKRAAIDEYEAIMRASNLRVGTTEYDAAEHAEEAAGQRLIETPAATPGGIAFRLAHLLAVIDESDLTGSLTPWMRDMVRAALRDALTQERQRFGAHA